MQKVLISIAALLLLASCSVYKLEIQQGNALDEKSVSELKLGMDRRQVSFLLGTPTIADPFHKDRWDYLYEHWVDGARVEHKHLALFFENNLLTRIEPR
jgi:outer membrane protein assembly factor BamE